MYLLLITCLQFKFVKYTFPDSILIFKDILLGYYIDMVFIIFMHLEFKKEQKILSKPYMCYVTKVNLMVKTTCFIYKKKSFPSDCISSFLFSTYLIFSFRFSQYLFIKLH